MKEVLEEPGSKNADRTLGKSSLRPPWLLLHHAHLMERPLLPQALLQKSKPRSLPLRDPRYPPDVLLSQNLAGYLQLADDGVPQASEMPGHGLLRKAGVGYRRTNPQHRVEGVHQMLHLLTVVGISPIHLE